MKRLPRIGMLTPSSNTVLEPESVALIAGLPCTVHFARFPVIAISLDPEHRAQFQLEPMLTAARLLQDAACDVIAWNGTSAGWLGIDSDHQLCQRINDETGAFAISTTQALLQAAPAMHMQRIGLVVPYESSIVQAIAQTFKNQGLDVVQEKHLGLRRNQSFADVQPTEIDQMIADVGQDIDGIVIFCTNFAGAPLVAKWEERLQIPIIDSVTVTMWAALQTVGISQPVVGWGRLMAEAPSFRPIWPTAPSVSPSFGG